MWGREMRAGLVFVIAALLIGQGFREWKRAHEERFQDLIRELEARDLKGREEGASAGDSAADEVTPRAGSRAPAPRAPREIPVGRIDLNRASALELERLPGIGPALAARIVADRERRGVYPSPEALLRVPGIGPKILGRIRAYLDFSAVAGEDSLTGF